MFRTGKQTTYFQTTEQRSVYDPSRGHTFSHGQVSLQEGMSGAWKKKKLLFWRNRNILYLIVLLCEYKERKPCGYLPEITTVFGLHLSCGLRDS